MISKPTNWLTLGLCLAALVLFPLAGALGQCGGWCDTEGTCPGSTYDCEGGICCYCCETCQQAVCSQELVCTIQTNPPIPVYKILHYQQLWFRCYNGSPCTFTGWQSQELCNENCPEPYQC
jgi:hypothetical protein